MFDYRKKILFCSYNLFPTEFLEFNGDKTSMKPLINRNFFFFLTYYILQYTKTSKTSHGILFCQEKHFALQYIISLLSFFIL